MKSKRVMITGAAGFIGRRISEEFSANGWYVIGLGHGNWPDYKASGVDEWHQGEVTLQNMLACESGGVEVLIHCAGGSSVGLSVEKPHADFSLTVVSTAAVLEYVRLYSPETRVIYLSSAAVYGQVTKLPIGESSLRQPVSPYGTHKKIAEILCESYAKNYDISVSIIRLFSIYGEHLKKQLLWDACVKFDLGDRRFFGTGEEIRDWLHVSDVARLLFLVAEASTTGCSILNAASGQGTSIREILTYMEKNWWGQKEPEFSSTAKAGDPSAYVAEIGRAKALGWRPMVGWRDGVADYVEWFRKCQKYV